MAKKFELGRGLSDILQEASIDYQQGKMPQNASLSDIAISLIKPNPSQPRKNFDENALKELSKSIKENGLLQPILIYENENNEFILIAGERRLRASKMAGLDSIQAIVLNVDKNKLRQLALIENIQRENLNPIELAMCFKELLQELGLTHEELAQKIQKSRSQVTNTLRLLELSKYCIEKIINNEISQGHAKILVNLDSNMQKKIVDLIIEKKLSVQETEKIVKNIKNSNDKNIKKAIFNIEPNKLSQIKNFFKDIKITSKNNKIIFSFENENQIDSLLKKLKL